MVATIIRDSAGTARTVTAWLVRDAGNVQRTITEAWVRDINNVPRLVYNPSGSATLNATVDPEYAHKTIIDGSGSGTTETVTVTPTGGTAPYTYAWTLISTNLSPDPTADSPTSETTSFSQTGLSGGNYVSSVFRCTVTDDNAATAYAEVAVTFYAYEGGF